MKFDPFVQSLGFVSGATMEDLRAEQGKMLHSASPQFLQKHGGKLAKRVYTGLMSNHIYRVFPLKDYYTVIDTKVVMLMPGMYPAIPGWHCDAVPREDVHGQPDLTKMDNEQYHFVCSMSNIPDGSRTDIITASLEIPYDELHVWKSVSENVPPKILVKQVQNNELVVFSTPTIHRATPATKREFRFFFRLSYYRKPPQNKIRHQVQVYTTEHGGW